MFFRVQLILFKDNANERKKTNESEERRVKSEETKFGGRRESQSNGSEYRESRAENVMKYRKSRAENVIIWVKTRAENVIILA